MNTCDCGAIDVMTDGVAIRAPTTCGAGARPTCGAGVHVVRPAAGVTLIFSGAMLGGMSTEEFAVALAGAANR